MNRPLDGKIALVTGSSRGIGAAVARRLAHDGASVVVHYVQDRVAASNTANEIARTGGTSWVVQADLSSPDGVTELMAALPFARFDILINNAAVISYSEIAAMTASDLDHLLSVNVRSLFLLTQHAHERLNNDGRIINISSAAGRIYFPSVPAYAASKGFMEALTLHAAPVFASRDITVNAVAPGVTDTDMSRWVHETGGLERLKQMQALGGIGKPDYIAAVVAFLSGPDGKWITGQTIEASGGLRL